MFSWQLPGTKSYIRKNPPPFCSKLLRSYGDQPPKMDVPRFFNGQIMSNPWQFKLRVVVESNPQDENFDFNPPKVDCSWLHLKKRQAGKQVEKINERMLSFCFRNFSEFISSTLRIPGQRMTSTGWRLQDDLSIRFCCSSHFCFSLHLLFGRHHFQNIFVQHHEAFLLTEKRRWWFDQVVSKTNGRRWRLIKRVLSGSC